MTDVAAATAAVPSPLLAPAALAPLRDAVPCVAVHGQRDLLCPPAAAAALRAAWPELELRLVPGAGHSMYDPGIAHELVGATDAMRAAFPAWRGPTVGALNGRAGTGAQPAA
jgi:proline iminopeptidase